MASEISVFSTEVIRGIIWFCYKQGDAPNVIHDKLKAVYGEDTITLGTVYNWCGHFSTGSTIVSDKPRTGHPRIPDSVDAVSKVLQDQPYASSSYHISSVTGLSKTTVLKILHEDLKLQYFDGYHMPSLQNKNSSAKRVQEIFLLNLTALNQPGFHMCSLRMNHGSFMIIHNKPSGHRAETKQERDPVKHSQKRRLSLWYSGLLQDSST